MKHQNPGFDPVRPVEQVICSLCDNHVDIDSATHQPGRLGIWICDICCDNPADSICGYCAGSGLGYHGENTTCIACKGSGDAY